MGLTSAGANVGTNAQNLFNTATGTNPTQSFMNYGNNLANSSMANSMIDAANLDVSRDLNQTQLPSLAVQAAGNGNTDSTRTGVAQALLQSQAQQNMLQNATNIRSNLFNTGANMAQSQYNANQTQALNANAQVGSAYQLGNSALLNGQQANGNNFDQMTAAGSMYQGQQQNVDNAAQQYFQDQQSTPLNLIGQYMNVINGKWGGQPVSSVGPSVAGSAIQGALGGGLTAAGLADKLGGFGDTGAASFGNSFTMPGGNDYASAASSAVAVPTGLSAFGYGY
ncbi:hypothetical protein [Caballeronia novacaledonica]|uniref:Uncharacterized protein n=1 Tax=Caballeronia novacaledonica TaxID=1544861 RepID=A0AA37MG40_9BURK|nr:hypothetical protein [Caballeronia novacaledonica]GJH23805.1 hypothetical protein CBA19CS42_04835 [Caballeronia novacaledonica]